MVKDKQGILMAVQNNPFKHIETKYNEIDSFIKTWLPKQSLTVEAAVVTVTSAVQGAATGVLMSPLFKDFSSPPPPFTTFNPQSRALAVWHLPLVQARKFAVMMGVDEGLRCVLRRLKGKEDVETRMVTAFGSGVMHSLVIGTAGPHQAACAITTGPLLSENSSKSKVEELSYNETRGMLSSLGLERYEKNFKRGLLTDKTLPLLTDSALQYVKIPLGPRLLILDHIEREKEVKKWGKRK